MSPDLPTADSLPRLEGPRVALRALTLDDADELFAVFSDPLSMRYWSEPPHPSRERTAELIGEVLEGSGDRLYLQWGISRNDDGRLIGTVTLVPERDQPRAEIGYILGSEHWRQGYGGDAQALAIDYAFGTLGLHRVEADTHPQNVASVRSLERLGFRIEGLQRERWLVAGERSDSLLMGLLASEWGGGAPATASGP